jgi:L-aminopeptidase/D-esterase-like protein
LLKVGEAMLILGGTFKVIAGAANAITVVKGVSSGISAISKAASGAGALNTVAAALRALAGAGAAFLASPLGKLVSGVGVILGTTSFEPQSDARRQLVKMYGYDYWKYLKGRHPGTNPYSFDRGSGDLAPNVFHSLHGHLGKEALKSAVADPVRHALTGGGSTSIAQVIEKQTGQLLRALENLALHITVQGPDGKTTTLHEMLRRPGQRTSGGVYKGSPHSIFGPIGMSLGQR